MSKKKKRGTLRIDRSFPGVGRIARATGTHDPKMRRRISADLTDLYERWGRLDILKDLRDGRLSFLEVRSAIQRGELDRLATGLTTDSLADALESWREKHECSQSYRTDILTTIRYLSALNPKATVRQLPELLERLRDEMAEHAPSFNRTRAHALAFVRTTFKRSHPLWREVQAVERRKEKVQRPAIRLSPDEMRALFPLPLTDAVDGIAWSIATSGMHQAELWGEWHVEADRIVVEGTKTAGRSRVVPLVMRPVVPSMHRRTFENKFRERPGVPEGMVVYHLRGMYAHWLEEAHVPRTRRRMYLGHESADTTDRYEQTEVARFLAEDAERVRAYIGLGLPPTLRLERKA